MEENKKMNNSIQNENIISENTINLKSGVKSLFIKQKIFSFISSNIKLKIFVYSKCFQNILKIDINDYKLKAKRYIEGERNGKGKEYSLDTNILLFEGEYLDRKRNGKGKEYNEDGQLIFEGNYIKGKRNGKGYEYYFNGNLKYEDEYLNGERNGKGKEYFINGNIYFIGEYLKGKKWNGKGYNKYGGYAFKINNGNGYTLEYDTYDNLIFEGEYFNGEKNGKGYEYVYNENQEANVVIFEGEYLNGIKNGKGKKYYDNSKLKFDGEYLNGKKWNGKGYDRKGNVIYELKNGDGYVKKYYYDYVFKRDTLIYEGEYKNGEKNGKGKEYDKYGKLTYEGEYKDGKKNGKGKKYYHNDKDDYINNYIKFEGEFLNGKKWNGKGYDKKRNIIYELKNGNGYLKKYYYEYYDRGHLIFEGEYKNSEKNGKGKEYDHYGALIYEGEYKDGKKHGKGKEYDHYGALIYEGEYLKGKEWNIKANSCYGHNLMDIIQIDIKNGNGKIKKFRKYSKETKRLFEGEYKNGEKNGFVYEYGFEGQYINGKRNGKGKEFSSDKIKFEGEYLNGKRWKGKGEEIYEEDLNDEFYTYTEFKGEYLYGQKWNGIGENGDIYYKNGFKYNRKKIKIKRKYNKYYKIK